MIDHDGEWLTVYDAARAVRVRPSTIYVWINRQRPVHIRVKHIRIPGTPGKPRVYVHMPDVMDAEKAWRDWLATRGATQPRRP